MKRMFTLFGLVLVLTGMTAAGGRQSVSAQATDAQSVAAAYKAAWTAGDPDAILALYADNAVQLTGFGDVLQGRAAIRAFVAGFIQQNPGFNVTWSESAVVLNTAVQRGFYSSDPIKAAGVGRVVGIDTLVISGGKIVSVTGQLDLSDPETAQFARALGGQ